MRRWFLSYNSQDLGLIASLESGLRSKDPDARIFFAPKSLRAGGLWLPELAREIAEATAFVLLVGEKGIGPWQAIEYYEALDRRGPDSNHRFRESRRCVDSAAIARLMFPNDTVEKSA